MTRSHRFDKIGIVFIFVVACILMSNLPVMHGDCSALPIHDTPSDQHYHNYSYTLSPHHDTRYGKEYL
jgi:hypothetical protein